MAESSSRPWYENAFLLAVAGSIIAVIGQLAGTLIPIMYGPDDLSDFSVGISPVNIKVAGTIGYGKFVEFNNDGKIIIEDFHHFLRPYRFGVFLSATDVPFGINISFSPPEIKPGETSSMRIEFRDYSQGEYPITIRGIGGDGKIRETRFILSCE